MKLKHFDNIDPRKLQYKTLKINFFSDGMEWEAKFYQIQSKYLLLLNELHNPQDGVSSSRKEIVTQLLKDIVEAEGEKQNFETGTDLFDRFEKVVFTF